MRLSQIISFGFVSLLLVPPIRVCGDGIGGSVAIVRVEEDWELIVSTPDPLQDAPQVSTWMSPTGSLDEWHFGLDINHAQKIGYDGGGFQTKACHGSDLFHEFIGKPGENLNQAGDTVRWTQLMAIHNSHVIFGIKNGSSTSWGNFGGTETMVTSAMHASNLNAYNPDLSRESSGVGFAANRVGSLCLVRFRLYTQQGLAQEIELNYELLE
jgi:hypothetical protein